MPTIFGIYNAKDAQKADEYERYLKERKVQFVRSNPIVESFDVYRVEHVVGPLVSDPVNPPSMPPYEFVAKIEVSSLEQFGGQMQSEQMQEFIKEYSPMLEPSAVFASARKVEPGS